MAARSEANLDSQSSAPPALWASWIDDVAPVQVGPGCTRRDLPSHPGVRIWVVDMAPGSQWPCVDVHDLGEEVHVVSGELIEGDRRFGSGTYLFFPAGSSHQPRTETGVRLFGINPARDCAR